MKEQTLKRCPFCGMIAKVTPAWGSWFVIKDGHSDDCILSGAGLTAYESIPELIKAWNTRAKP